MNIRLQNWHIAKNRCFDIAVIGGGINGAAIYRTLCERGHKVFLFDKGDFSCGTSQSSAMMIWGGLLYLRNLDFLSVYRFSRDRDILIDSFNKQVVSQYFRYIPNSNWGRNKHMVYLALLFYWLLGKCRRNKPVFQKYFDELAFILDRDCSGSLLYQEGFLKYSDSRFVLDWIFDNQTETSLSLNYCMLKNAHYINRDRSWRLELKDSLTEEECSVSAKIVINCSGVWTDEVNSTFGIKSPCKHVFSKGVFIGYERPDGHNMPLIFEMGENGDTLTLIPWGPISLWGPTETPATSIQSGYSITPDDVNFLLKHACRNLKSSLANSKIISFRCGLRPLAVPRSFEPNCYPLDISRDHKIIEDPNVPWISVYGGKISGCISLATALARKVSKKIPPSQNVTPPAGIRTQMATWASFPGLSDRVPSIDWCVSNEFCCTLEDYLRRRTNISQWVPREGLGFNDCNLQHIGGLSLRLPRFKEKEPVTVLREYMDKVRIRFDALTEQI